MKFGGPAIKNVPSALLSTAAVVAVTIAIAMAGGAGAGAAAPRTISIQVVHTEAEFAALGGELLAQEDDLYEKCAAPAQCYCWTRPASAPAIGVDHADAGASQDGGVTLCRAVSRP